MSDTLCSSKPGVHDTFYLDSACLPWKWGQVDRYTGHFLSGQLMAMQNNSRTHDMVHYVKDAVLSQREVYELIGYFYAPITAKYSFRVNSLAVLTNPRNPRHFGRIEGGRNSVSGRRTTKDTQSL